jgi:hypothetical protein
MSKLRARLLDPSHSGVYRVLRTDAIEEAVRGSRLNLGRINLAGVSGKEAMLERIASALAFPDWFGGNWDALEDCLIDLSWCEAEGHVLVFTGAQPGDDTGVLIDVLASSAEFWAARGRPFFAAFVDPLGVFQLAQLHRDR